MKTPLFLLGSVLLAALPAAAATTVYTDQASFLAALSPGYYQESFDALNLGLSVASPLTFSQNGLSYQAATPDGSAFFPVGPVGDSWLSTNFGGQPIVFSPSGGTINAVGGYFFLTGFDGNPTTGVTTLSLGDGTTATLTDATPATFLGFVSSGPISSLTETPPSDMLTFAAANDFIVGQAAVVPEPSTWAMAVGGLGVLLVFRRRRRTA